MYKGQCNWFVIVVIVTLYVCAKGYINLMTVTYIVLEHVQSVKQYMAFLGVIDRCGQSKVTICSVHGHFIFLFYYDILPVLASHHIPRL